MAASRTDIDGWFERGVAAGRRYMVVICDTFDWEDYPIYFDTADAAQAKMRNPGDMQKVMECYDLSADKSEQFKRHRAMALVV